MRWGTAARCARGACVVPGASGGRAPRMLCRAAAARGPPLPPLPRKHCWLLVLLLRLLLLRRRLLEHVAALAPRGGALRPRSHTLHAPAPPTTARDQAPPQPHQTSRPSASSAAPSAASAAGPPLSGCHPPRRPQTPRTRPQQQARQQQQALQQQPRPASRHALAFWLVRPAFCPAPRRCPSPRPRRWRPCWGWDCSELRSNTNTLPHRPTFPAPIALQQHHCRCSPSSSALAAWPPGPVACRACTPSSKRGAPAPAPAPAPPCPPRRRGARRRRMMGESPCTTPAGSGCVAGAGGRARVRTCMRAASPLRVWHASVLEQAAMAVPGSLQEASTRTMPLTCRAACCPQTVETGVWERSAIDLPGVAPRACTPRHAQCMHAWQAWCAQMRLAKCVDGPAPAPPALQTPTRGPHGAR